MEGNARRFLHEFTLDVRRKIDRLRESVGTSVGDWQTRRDRQKHAETRRDTQRQAETRTLVDSQTRRTRGLADSTRSIKRDRALIGNLPWLACGKKGGLFSLLQIPTLRKPTCQMLTDFPRRNHLSLTLTSKSNSNIPTPTPPYNRVCSSKSTQ